MAQSPNKPSSDQSSIPPDGRSLNDPRPIKRPEEKDTGASTVIIMTEGFRSKLDKALAMKERSKTEIREKKDKVSEVLEEAQARREKFQNEGIKPEQLADLEKVIDEAQGHHERLDEMGVRETNRLKSAERVTNEFRRQLTKILNSTFSREKKIDELIRLRFGIQNAPKELASRGVKREDFSGVLTDLEELLFGLQREECAEEFKEIGEEDRSNVAASDLMRRLNALIERLEKIPQSEELLKEVQQVREAVQEELNTEDKKRIEHLKSVRRAACESALCLEQAVKEEDPKKKRSLFVEGVNLLKKAIVADDGTVDHDRVNALELHFSLGSMEYGLRSTFLDVAKKNPTTEVTAQNVSQLIDDRTYQGVVGDSKPPAQKNEHFVTKRDAFLKEPEPGVRKYRLSMLKMDINKANAGDQEFAQQYGQSLLGFLETEIAKCDQLMADKWDDPNKPVDVSAAMRALDKKLEGDDASVVKDPSSSTSKAPETPTEKTPKISRSVKWTAGAVLAVIAGVWGASRMSNNPSSPSDTDTAPEASSSSPVPSTTPAIPNSSTPPDPREIERRLLESARSQFAQELQGIKQDGISPLSSRIGAVNTLLGRINTHPNRGEFQQVADEAIVYRTRLEGQQAEEALAASRREVRQRQQALEAERGRLQRLLSELQGTNREKKQALDQLLAEIRRVLGENDPLLMQAQAELLEIERLFRLEKFQEEFGQALRLPSDEAKKLALEDLLRRLAFEPAPGFPQTMEGIQSELQQVNTRREIVARRDGFQQRLTIISGTDEDQKRLLEGLLNDIRNDHSGDYSNVAAAVQERLRQVEARILQARKTQLEQEITGAENLPTDEQKRDAFQALETRLAEFPPLVTRARQGREAAEARIDEAARRTAAPLPTPAVPDVAPVSTSVRTEFSAERARAAAEVDRLGARIAELEQTIQQWTNHLVIEDAQRRRTILEQSRTELAQRQAEQRPHQTLVDRIDRVLRLDRADFQRRIDELERSIQAQQIPMQREEEVVKRLEALRVRTPGEDRQLASARQRMVELQREIDDRRDEQARINRLRRAVR